MNMRYYLVLMMVCDFHQNICVLFSFLEAAQGLSYIVVKNSFVSISVLISCIGF